MANKHMVYDQDGKPIGRMRIPADIERMLWERRAGDRVRMPVLEPLEFPTDIATADVEAIHILIIDFWVNHWRYERRIRSDFGAIIAHPAEVVRYEMTLQAEADAKRLYNASPSEDAYNGYEKATAARKAAREALRKSVEK